MAVKESYFWSQVKQGLTDAETHLCRIENTAGTGISDINACHNGCEAWLELKIFHGQRLHFRTSQRVWIFQRKSCGGRVFVLARKDFENGGAEMRLYDAALLLVGVPSKVEKDGKAFSIHEVDMPAPIFVCRKPFDWKTLRHKIFASGFDISVPA